MKLLLLFSLGSFVGCSTSYTIGPSSHDLTYSKFAETVKDERVVIVFSDSTESEGIIMSVDSNYVQWIVPESRDVTKTPTASLRRVIQKNHSLGALEGLGIGTGAALGVSAIGGAIVFFENPSNKNHAGSGVAVLGVLSTTLGAVGGTIVGAFWGHTDRYEFSEEKQH